MGGRKPTLLYILCITLYLLKGIEALEITWKRGLTASTPCSSVFLYIRCPDDRGQWGADRCAGLAGRSIDYKNNFQHLLSPGFAQKGFCGSSHDGHIVGSQIILTRSHQTSVNKTWGNWGCEGVCFLLHCAENWERRGLSFDSITK